MLPLLDQVIQAQAWVRSIRLLAAQAATSGSDLSEIAGAAASHWLACGLNPLVQGPA